MVERRSRDRRRHARPEPIGAEATAPRCPSAAAALTVVAEEPEPALDTGLDPEADSVRAQEELRDWLEPRRTPVDRRDEAAKALRPDQPIQYPQPYRGKRSRATLEWTPEIALQIRRERVRAREHRRAMEREYETLSAGARESVRDRTP
ncbi:hypothetical protein QAD02_013271 [Eretmocerus hayati]|uniref:Uncharacterized protein n=1 Tax=Eretmocerus hayati TaxID=131215 RepID=A0ACC2P1P4_9HYME|nr:hypothetical protein QAD02_013271 [Eretmocerus hayati]